MATSSRRGRWRETLGASATDAGARLQGPYRVVVGDEQLSAFLLVVEEALPGELLP